MSIYLTNNPDILDSIKINTYDNFFKNTGKLFSIDPDILKAIAIHESRLKSTVRGDSGHSIGLMQIHDDTWKGYESKYNIKWDDLIDPEKNILAGAIVLNDKIANYGSLKTGIYGYRGEGGRVTPGNVKFYLEIMEIYDLLKKHRKSTFSPFSSVIIFMGVFLLKKTLYD